MTAVKRRIDRRPAPAPRPCLLAASLLLAVPGAALAHAPQPPAASAPADLEPQTAPPTSSAPGSGRRIPIGAYGEAYLINEGEQTQATLRRFVAFFGHSFAEWARFYSELEVEDAKAVEMEQAYVELAPGRRLGFRGGLLLVPLGIVNIFHEPPTFNGVERPVLDQIIIPSTWRELGVGIFGEVVEGLQYQLYAMNGLNASLFSAEQAIRPGRGEGSNAKSRDFAITGRLDFNLVLGLDVGAGFYFGGASQGVQGLDGVRVGIVEGDARFSRHGLMLRAQYARVFISNAAKITGFQRLTDPAAAAVGSAAQGFYLEGGYDVLRLVTFSEQQLMPFVRYENVNPRAGLPDVTDPGSSDAQQYLFAGLTYRPHPQIAFKGDYRRFLAGAPSGAGRNRLAFGIGFMF